MHTPGPWTMIADPYEDGTPHFRFNAGDAFAEKDFGFELSGILRQDDASLIVAAPELLEVLKAFVAETVDYMTINHLGDPEGQHNVKWARRVIAKAESR